LSFIPLVDLSDKQARREIAALRAGIEFHNRRYFIEHRPQISDAQYDKLFRRLEQLEHRFPRLCDATSPTRRVGGRALASRQPIKHAAVMLSLHAASGEEEVKRFCQNVSAHLPTASFFLEPKFDGVSVELCYRQGAFQYAATRGDGLRGDDVTENVCRSKGLPLRLKGPRPPKFLSVRGEAYISKTSFQRLNKARLQIGLEPFANPRNGAAGLLARLQPDATNWPLELVVYDILKSSAGNGATQHVVCRLLTRWGFAASRPTRLVSTLRDIVRFHDRLSARRDALPMEIDGIVIKADNLAVAASLGVRDRSPRGALAWKFAPREGVTTLEDIIVQVGKSGALTPVALLAPVDVGGVTVSRATLHNEHEIHRKDIRRGDTVRITRAGDVIPEIVGVVATPKGRRSRPFKMPTTCSVCGAKIIREGPICYCPAGLSCPGQLVGCLTHFGSREALDIKGLGVRTACQLVEQKLVKNVSDLFYLTPSDLSRLVGFAETSARNLYRSIQQARKARLDRFLHALAIRHVGRRTAAVLAHAFRTLDSIRSARSEQLSLVTGPVVARSVREFFDNPGNVRVLRRLAKAGVEVLGAPLSRKAQSLQGKAFVFTGELSRWTRHEAQEAVEARGGRAMSNVCRTTDYVVVGVKPGSKFTQARKLGIKVLSEQQFDKLLAS
jgi:DNA ligase (NAD+)